MRSKDRTESEVTLEEQEEAERHDALYKDPEVEKLKLNPSDWLKFDSISNPLNPYYASMLRLGNVNGKEVLDAGCGDGWLSVILAKRGAIVRGFDISSEGVKTAQLRAAVNGVSDRCNLVTGSFYDIPFEDRSFDLVIGQAILHHLRNKELASPELFRVMRPGSKAVFVEPFGNSAILERVRLMVPVPSMAPEDPTEWKRQFKYSDLKPFADRFDLDWEEFHFFSRLDRIFKSRAVTEPIAKLDRRLLRALPFLRPLARSIVVEMRPKAD